MLFSGRCAPNIAAFSPAASSYSAEANALFARMSVQPDATRKGLIDALIVSLKSAGVWAKLDALWMLAAADSQAALLNWVSTSFNGTIVGSPVFTADRGFLSVTVTGYVLANYTPSVDGVLFTLNNAHLSAWSRTIDAGVNASGADVGGVRAFVTCRGSTGNAVGEINDATPSARANSDGTGHFLVTRPDSATKRLFRNGAQLGADFAVASTSISSASLRIGGVSTTGSEREWAMASLGGDLTVQEASDFYSALNTYMTAVGVA